MTEQTQKPIRVTDGEGRSPSGNRTGSDDGDELDDVLAAHDRVLVEFYTKGCAMCQAIEPVLGNVTRETGVTVAMVNPGNDITLVEEWDVRSVPTLVLVENGEEVARLADGFQGGEAIEEFLERHA